MIHYVFIAGPYTGDQGANVRASCIAADQLTAAGFVPFNPLLYHFADLITPHKEEDWKALDLEWLSRCDALVRLPGDSRGADEEVAYALEHGIPVFNSLDSLRRAAWIVVDVPDGPDD